MRKKHGEFSPEITDMLAYYWGIAHRRRNAPRRTRKTAQLFRSPLRRRRGAVS